MSENIQLEQLLMYKFLSFVTHIELSLCMLTAALKCRIT